MSMNVLGKVLMNVLGTYYRERTGEHTVERTLRNVLRGPHWGAYWRTYSRERTGGCITMNFFKNVLCIIGNALGNVFRFVLGMYWGNALGTYSGKRGRCQKVAIIIF